MNRQLSVWSFAAITLLFLAGFAHAGQFSPFQYSPAFNVGGEVQYVWGEEVLPKLNNTGFRPVVFVGLNFDGRVNIDLEVGYVGWMSHKRPLHKYEDKVTLWNIVPKFSWATSRTKPVSVEGGLAIPVTFASIENPVLKVRGPFLEEFLEKQSKMAYGIRPFINLVARKPNSGFEFYLGVNYTYTFGDELARKLQPDLGAVAGFRHRF